MILKGEQTPRGA